MLVNQIELVFGQLIFNSKKTGRGKLGSDPATFAITTFRTKESDSYARDILGCGVEGRGLWIYPPNPPISMNLVIPPLERRGCR